MLHKVMKKLVYIRYEQNISVSAELKKGIKEDGTDGYEVGVLFLFKHFVAYSE